MRGAEHEAKGGERGGRVVRQGAYHELIVVALEGLLQVLELTHRLVRKHHAFQAHLTLRSRPPCAAGAGGGGRP